MKLAEGLLLRAEYQQKMESLRQRILKNAKIQEGDKPDEDPNILLAEFDELNKKLSRLVTQINQCNHREKLANGRTISEALIIREEIIQKRNLLVSLQSTATDRSFRLTRTEIKIKSAVNITDIQQEINHLSKEFRKLDTMIQKGNWLVEL